MIKRIGVGVLAAALLAGMYFAFIVRTPYGHRAVIWPDNATEERAPGFSFAVRPLQSVYFVDVREQRLVTVDAEGKANGLVQTEDLQEIFLRASLIWRIQPDQAAEVYDTIGNVDKVLPIISALFYDAIKEAGGKRLALSFASDLSTIADDIKGIIAPQLAERGIQVLSVAVEDAVFDALFMEAIKNKVIALEREKETETLERVADNEASAILARGNAEAAVQDALAMAITPETVCYELAKQGVRCVPDVVAGDAPLIYDLGPEP